MSARVGGWILSADPMAHEAVGRAGYDFVVVDLQHGSLDFSAAIRALQLLDLLGVRSFIRISSTQVHEVPRYLDFGAGGVIVATVDDPATAERAVRMTRYQPDGARSYGGARFGMSHEPSDVADVRPEVWIMIETEPAASRTAAIASVPGVTGLLVGPADLSRAWGLPPSHRSVDPRWNEAVAAVVRDCRAAGIASCFTARDGADARHWLDEGFDHVVVGSDLAHLRVALGRELSLARGEAVHELDVEV